MDYNRISELATDYTEKSAQFLREIITIPSTSCNEGPVVERIAQEMDETGFDEVIIDPMGNTIAHGGKGEGLVIAEIDTEVVADIRAKLPFLKDRRF